jgi:sigma-B regulation protein RsbU (phosphoserine phosphatase)
MNFRNPSVRILIALLVILPIVAVSVALVILFTANSKRVAEDLGANIVRNSTERVVGEVEIYLQSAVRVSDRYTRQIETGSLFTSNLRTWEPKMLDDLATLPDVASICFGNEAGDSTWLLRNEGRLEVGGSVGGQNDQAAEYRMELDGRIAAEPIKKPYFYDPRARPWYTLAASSDLPTWTPVYFWFGSKGNDSQVGTGYTRAIRDRSGKLIGALVIDVTLGALSDYLRELPFSRQGYLFVVDNDEQKPAHAGDPDAAKKKQRMLIASSHGAVNSPAGERLMLSESADPVARAAAAALNGPHAADFLSGELSQHSIDIGGQPARIRVTNIQPYRGIDWKIIAVIPERQFLAKARAAQWRAIAFATVAIVASVLLGLHLAGQLASPVLRLIEHVRRVGRGDFESRVNLTGAQELAELSGELNKMAGDLKNYIDVQHSLTIAQEIQQSLLPAEDPNVPGLDIAGRSQYCESTGGDYFDFIDVSTLDDRKLLIAVGDVVGHGVGAALLMAAARAAVRSHARLEVHLANLMRKVNHVLSEDRRHNQFMTLVLMVIDPVTQTIRWANAGHDPAIIYRARTGTIEQLHGGDIPLGIETDIKYENYEFAGIEPGDVMIIGTDGIWDTRNDAGDRFGKERLQDVIRQNAMLGSAEIARRLEEVLGEYRQCRPPVDDVTFVIVKMTELG